MAEIKEFGLEVQRTLRYYALGDPENASVLLISLHGFGQLAQFFIKNLDIGRDEIYVIAPEGMHRFYLQGNSGRVGASWMTKEARELDITENSIALDALLKEIKSRYNFTKVILLGFSQGGATAARWFFQSPKSVDNLILWASVFPPDLEKPTITPNASNYFVLGNQDEYYTEEQQISEIDSYEKMGFQTVQYKGKHAIDKGVLADILNRLI